MNSRSLILAFVLMAALPLFSQAQDDEEPVKGGFDKSKLFFGGNFGAGFGSNTTLVNLSPQVGYRFSRFFAAGAGVNFLYSSYRYYYPDYRVNYGVGGLNVFGRVYPIEYVFLQLQPEANYVWGKYKFYDGTSDQKIKGQIVPSLLGGVGAAIPSGGRGAFIITVNYDLLQDINTPYGNKAFFNFGYNIGL